MPVGIYLAAPQTQWDISVEPWDVGVEPWDVKCGAVGH